MNEEPIIESVESKTIQLTYQQCAEHAKNWEALGRNYTAVHKEEVPPGKGQPGLGQQYIFHLLDLDTVETGIQITVIENRLKLYVSFLPSGRYANDYSYSMDAVPRQPFRNPERIRAWADFISAMTGGGNEQLTGTK